MAAGSPLSRPLERPRGAVTGITLVAGGRLPLAFISAGLGAFAVASVTLALNPGVLLLPVIHPYVVALAHLWLPGFLLSVCLGAIYQLMPVVLGTPLMIKNVGAWTHLVLHLVGVTLDGITWNRSSGHFDLPATHPARGGTWPPRMPRPRYVRRLIWVKARPEHPCYSDGELRLLCNLRSLP